MNVKEYVDLVNNNVFPESIEVPLDAPFKDERGVIQNIWLGNSGSTTLITTKAGSVRANHWHQDDWHVSYVISGIIHYSESNIDSSNLKTYIFKVGQSFLSPPMKWHKMEFPEDTVFITMNGISKSNENYEKDIVRVK